MLAAAGSGCVSRGNVDLLESRLREQEDRLSALQSTLAETESELAVARSEAVALRSRLDKAGEEAILPEQAGVLYSAAGIKINTLMTAGDDRDGAPGDDVLSVVVAPHDHDGELLKLPGDLEFTLLDLTKNAEEQHVGRWSFGIDEVREHWTKGLFATGFQFDLPWQELPANSELLLHARLTTIDGRQFDTSAVVTIDLPGGSISNGDERDSPAGRSNASDLGPADELTTTTPASSTQDGLPNKPPVSVLRETNFRPERLPLPSPPSDEKSNAKWRKRRASSYIERTSDSWTDATIPRLR